MADIASRPRSAPATSSVASSIRRRAGPRDCACWPPSCRRQHDCRARAASLKRSLLRSATIYAAANILSAGVPFILLPVLTRKLTPSQYGEVVSFYMLVAVCSSLAGLGLHAAVGVRWLDPAKGDPAKYTASAVLLALLTTAFAAAVAAVLAPQLGLELAPALCALAAVVAGTTVLQ